MSLASWLALGVGIASVIVVGVVSLRRRAAVHELTREISVLGEGRTSRMVSPPIASGLARLAETFNEVAPRLEARLERLERDRQQLRAVLGGMTEGVIAIDSRHRLVFANEAAARLFQLGEGSVGRLAAELIRGPQVQSAIEATLAHPEPHRVVISVADPLARPRGETRILAVQGTPLPGNPPAGAVLVFHDVTDLRRLERMRQDFVTNASHELKTPLAALKAYTETLLDGALEDESVNRRFLQQIAVQSDRLDQLIQGLLTLARVEAGQEVYRHDALELVPIVTACVETQRGRAEAKELRLNLVLTGLEGRANVRADQEAVRQILDNLLDNAIKYTPAEGAVTVRCRSLPQSIAVEVVDTGIGIPRDDLPRVFERFYRVDKARSRELGGTGLGLAIVKHLVGSIGGKILVESRVGAGSTFTVQFPKADDGATEQA